MRLLRRPGGRDPGAQRQPARPGQRRLPRWGARELQESLPSRLSSAGLPVLAGLSTREGGDFTIALCDALATMLDVLAFYQERIVNENLLRTVTEQRSLLELARLIGYELAPRVAASGYLAFMLQEVPGSPRAGDRALADLDDLADKLG